MIDLEKERRITRKIRGLGKAIEAGTERDEYARAPIAYLEGKAAMQDKMTYTVADVARALQVTEDSVRRWIRNDKLEAAKIGRGYRISRAALAEFWRARGGGELFDNHEGEG